MKKIITILSCVFLGLSCTKSKLEDIDILPIEGVELTLQGLAGNESGAAAANAVFVDFSEEHQTQLLRASWDLGFYCGNDFRVVLNNTTTAMAVVLDKTDLNDVTNADVANVTFEINIAEPTSATFLKMDDLDGDLSKTVIPRISANPTENKVIVIGRGTGGGTPSRALVKAQINRTSNGDYQIKWSKIDEQNYQLATIEKDSAFNFKLLSFDTGLLPQGEPAKANWDIVWGSSVFRTYNGPDLSAYTFSDMVAINYLAGTQAVKKTYASASAATEAYNNYSFADVESEVFTSDRWTIGDSWRTTDAPNVTNPGVNRNRFYVIKDSEGNYFKLRFVSFTSEDGGTRGKPEINFQYL